MGKNKAKSSRESSATTITGNQVSGLTLRILFFVFAILLYGKTTGFEYTLDDELFISKNALVQKGLGGIGDALTSTSVKDIGHQPYRPVPMLTYIVEKVLTGNTAGAAHAVNLLLYAMVLQVLWTLLNRLFSSFHPLFNAAVVLLFAAHPLHVEVVASVKSRDELLATLFGLLAWSASINVFQRQNWDWKLVLKPALLLMLAMFSKESAIAFLVIIPLSTYLFVRQEIRPALLFTVVLAVPCVLFVWARYTIVGTEFSSNDIPVLANVLNAAPDLEQRIATKSVILWYWLKMSVLPWPLSWDYAFNQIPVASWDQVLPWMGILLTTGLFITGVFLLRRQPLAAFSILAFFIASAPTNNVLLEHASTFGERFMFISTIPFCLLLGWLVSMACRFDRTSVSGKGWRTFRLSLGVILLLYSGLTWSATSFWKDNLTLFERGVVTSPNSARTHYAYASECMTRSYTEVDPAARNAWLLKSRQHFDRSVEIFPDNHEALYNTGICMALSGDSSASIRAYTKAISLNGTLVNAMNNLGVIYEAMQIPDSAIRYYTMAMRVRPEERIARDNLSNLHFKQGLSSAQQGQKEMAIESYQRSIDHNPGNIMSLNNMASLYAGMQSYDSALVYLLKAQELDPGNQMLVENIAAVSFLNKQYDQAIRFAQLELSRNPSARKSMGVLADTYAAMGKPEESARYRKMQSEAR